MEQPIRHDLTRTVLAVLFIGGLIGASLWILRPFLAATVWSVMIVVTTWPVLRTLQTYLWGKRWLAATVMTASLLLVFVVPLSAAIGTIVANSGEIVGWASRLADVKLPPPPAFVKNIPIAGEKAASLWSEYADQGLKELAEIARPYASGATTWFVGEVGNFGLVGIQFLLTLAVTAILYMTGDDAAHWVRRFGRRLAGDRGEQVVRLAGQAVRGVALGVVVTALAQSVLGGIGLAIAGVPFAAMLTALMFMLALAQIGPFPVLLGALGWLWWQGNTGWFIALLVWSIAVSSLDSVLRPVLIRKGADLPLLLIFAGVIGGLFAFGLLGLFVGPVLLAVTYTLLNAWVSDAPEAPSGDGKGSRSAKRGGP